MSINIQSIEEEIKSKEQDIARQEERIARIKVKHDRQNRKERTHRLILRGIALETALAKVTGDKSMVERLGHEHMEQVLDTAFLSDEVKKIIGKFAEEL